MSGSAYETCYLSEKLNDEPKNGKVVKDLNVASMKATNSGNTASDSQHNLVKDKYTSTGSIEDLSASSCSVDAVSNNSALDNVDDAVGDGDDYDVDDDEYLASIELSNNCRAFYHNHVRSTAAFKQSVSQARQLKPMLPSSGIDAAMERLRNEMAELMDQDLHLMEQLLTLNDRIEEIKSSYIYSNSRGSLYSSECFSDSNISIYPSQPVLNERKNVINDVTEDDCDVVDRVLQSRDSNSTTPTSRSDDRENT